MLQHFRRDRAATVLVILTLGTGLGVTIAMLSLIDLLMFRPPSHVTDPARLVRVPSISNYVRYERLKRQLRTLDLAAYTRTNLTYGLGAQPTSLRVECVTPNFFDVLGTKLDVGHGFGSESSPESHAVVIGQSVHRRIFGDEPDVIGRDLILAGRAYRVVGVAPRDFTGVEAEPVDVWLSVVDSPELCAFTGRSLLTSESGAWLRTVGRIRDTFSLREADAEFQAAAAPGFDDPSLPHASRPRLETVAASKRARVTRDGRVALWAAGGAVAVLLMACANLAVFLTLRAMDRRLEAAVKLQLGATRLRVFFSFLAENVLVVAAALLTGAAVALWMEAALRQLFPTMPSNWFAVEVTAVVAGFAVVAFALGALVPAIQVAKIDAPAVLRTGQHVVQGRSSAHAVLLIGLLASAQVLLMTGGLFVRSVNKLMKEAGYDLDQVVVATLELERYGYTVPETWQVTDQIVRRLHEVQSVVAASASSATLLGSGGSSVAVSLRAAPQGDKSSMIMMNAVSSDYFTTLGTRLLEGRAFRGADTAGTPLVGIVDKGLANTHWPSQSPLGKCVFLSSPGPCIEIVGVSETRRPGHLTVAREEFFVPASQVGHYQTLHPVPRTLFIRVDGPVRNSLPSVVGVIKGLAPEVPEASVRPLVELADAQTSSWRLGATTFRLYGLLAGFMAAAGLYGVLAMAVRQRSGEIAVRMVFGATPAAIVRLIGRQAVVLLGAGWLLGVLLTLLVGHLIRHLLYEVAPYDTTTFLSVSAVMCLVVLGGALMPLLRAIRLTPAATLRES